MRKNLILTSILIIVAGVIVGYFLWFKSPASLAIKTMSPGWEEIFIKIHRDWEIGADLSDPHLLKNCPELKAGLENRFEELEGCRKKTFKCFYKNRTFKVKQGKRYTSFSVKFPKEESEKYWSLPIVIKSAEHQQRVYLQKGCRRQKVPRHYYNHGRFVSIKNTWHPGDVDYWLDKYLVRNIDINEWAQQNGSRELIYDDKKPFEPIVTLTLKQMKAFCHFQGGVVLSSRLADAVTYYSTESMKDGNLHKKLSPYPFTPRRSSSSHVKAQKNKDFVPSEKDCHRIYSQDCLELKVKSNPVETLGWSGVGELLGGHLEYVENEEYERRNLVLSSFYFPHRSPVHKAGERGFWDGEGHDISHFKLFSSHEIRTDKLFVAFRCMGVTH